MKYFLLLTALLVLSCAKKNDDATRAKMIVDMAIKASCNGNCEHAIIDFTFRDKCYLSKRNGGLFQYERIFADSTGVTRDVLTNDGFERYKNDALIALTDTTATKYANSVNSVLYFAQLPFGLDGPAVQKEYLGEARVKSISYHKIAVRFSEEGGGTDFEDEFVYWFNATTFSVDYLAYSYTVNGGGIRFREAYNERFVEGIRFVDYNNYKPEDINVPLTQLDDLFEKGSLKLLSKIETEAVGVRL